MKKLSMFFTVVCTIIVGVLFCACGNKYKNLEIKYLGKEDMIVLVMDNEYQSVYGANNEEGTKQNGKTKEIHFEVSGIKQKLMGEIKVQVVPQDLAELSEITINGTDIGFYIRALKSGDGSLEVTHLASGKNTSVMLHVDKKAISSSSNGDMLVVDIPNQQHLTEKEKEGLTEEEIATKEAELNQKIFTIDADTLLDFNPIDATDVVDWEVVDETGATTDLIADVEFGNFSNTENDDMQDVVNNQIKVSSNCAGGVFYLKPTLKMSGYDDLIQNFVVRVNVVKVLNKENIEILSKDAIASNTEKLEDNRYDDAKLIKDNIKLFANSISYSRASFAFFNENVSLLDSSLYNADLQDTNFNYGLYKISVVTSCSQIDVEDNKVALESDAQTKLSIKTLIGHNYSANKEWVEFRFSPNNAVGDIQPFAIKLNIDLTEIATKIDLKVDNEKVDTTIDNSSQTSADVILLDYYAKYNDYGQLFNFEVIKSSTDDSLKQMKIKVDKDILSPKNNGNKTSSSLYFLEFRKGSQFLPFYSVENENYYISSSFRYTERLYIKYVKNTNENASTDNNLTFDVVNFYDGRYDEKLEDINITKNVLTGTEKTLKVTVSRGRGVKSLDLNASNVLSLNGTTEHKLSNKEFYILNSAIQTSGILTKNDSWYTLNNNKSVYGFSIFNVVGASNSQLTDTEKMNIEFSFDVRKNGEIVDCFDFYQYIQANNAFQRLFVNKFHLVLEVESLFNNINLVRKDDTEIFDGEYVFTLYQESSGYKTSLVFNIVTNLSVGDLTITPFDSTLNSKGLYYNDYLPLETEPVDWQTKYGNYYEYDEENKKYVKVSSDSVPEFSSNKYYTTTFDGYMGNTYILPTNISFSTSLLAGKIENNNFVENSLLYQYISSIETKISVINSESKTTNIGATSYLNYVPSNILNTCRTGTINTTLLGTFLNGERHYIHIVYKVARTEYNIDENGFYLPNTSPTIIEIPIDIFVYVPLDRAYINDNISSTSVLLDDFRLGYYFKGLSTKEFSLNIPNPYGKNSGQSMFDYLTFEWKEHETLSGNDISYSADNKRQIVHFTQNSNAVIMVKITQFNQEINVICQVVVRSAINTTDIVVRNNLMTINNSKYISLNLGKTLKFDVDILGAGNFDEIKYVVCDNAGNVLNYYKVANNGQLLNVVDKFGQPVDADKQIYCNVAQDFKVLIFAKDWLDKDVDSEYNVYNFNDLTEYLIHSMYNERVKIVDVKIRDGSEYFPFLISEASELKEIATENNNGKYYQLTNDINMLNSAINLGDFGGHLNSFVDYKLLTSQPDDWTDENSVYYTYNAGKYEKLTAKPSFLYRRYYRAVQSHFTIYNVVLGDNSSNHSYNLQNQSTLPTNTKYLALFDRVNEDASISNITFQINYTETIVNANYQLVGVVGENLGTLNNVAVELNGKITVNNNTKNNELYIGGLVGKNFGAINQLDSQYVYSSGNLTVERVSADQGTKIYVGGLVGVNMGNIEGVLPTADQGVEYVLMYEEQGSLFNGEIKLVGTLKEEFRNSKYYINSAVGGVIGVNINLTNTKNKTDANKISDNNLNILNIIADENVENIKGFINNAYSSGKVVGGDVVGGMIGFNWGNGDNVETAYYVKQNDSVDTNASIANSLSTTKVTGENYVGGFAGFDYKGVSYHAYYEVYNTFDTVQGGTSVEGKKYVGGLIGYAFMSKLNYSYFHSFRWTYKTQNDNVDISFADSEFYYADKDNNKHLKQADVVGEQYIAGLIGYAVNNGETMSSKIVVYNSAVDAYIKATLNATDNATAGIIGYSLGAPKINNVYTQGFVEYFGGNSNGYRDARIFDGGAEITDTLTFVIYHKIYSYNADKQIELLQSNLPNNFTNNGSVNNGWYYITFDDENRFKGKNLITEAPTNIDMSKNVLSAQNVHGTTNFLDTDGQETTENKLIVLYYYNLTNTIGNNYLNDYNNINTIKLDNFINKGAINITPENIGVRLKVVSNNISVASILSNGSIRLNGEGVATIRFSSVINPSIFDEITVVVRGMPTDYQIYKTSTVSDGSVLDRQTMNIIKGSSKYVYENYTGQITINNTNYTYSMTSDVRVLVEKTDDNNNTIVINNSDSKNQKIDNLTPIIVSAQEKSADVVKIKLTPYVKFEINSKEYLVKIAEKLTREFAINTKQGASNISLDITDAVISKGDDMDINFEIATDEKIENLDISIDVKSQYGKDMAVEDNNGNEINKYDLLQFWANNINQIENQKLNLQANTFNADTQVQAEHFTIRVNQEAKIEKDLYITLTFRVHDQLTQLNLIVLPQRITSVVVNNFKEDTTQNSHSWSASQIIRPGKPNVITIDIAPDIAYYEYLEITDTYDEEKITFIQLDKFSSSQTGLADSKALNRIDEVSSDGYGIKLVKQTNDKRLYVYTLLSQMAEISTTHKLLVTVYSSSGYVLGSIDINLKSTIFPSVILSYLDAKDNKVATSDSRLIDTNQEANLAFGVEAKIDVRTINTDGSIDWTIDVLKDDQSYIDNKIGGLSRANLLKAFSITKKGDYYYLLTDYSALSNYDLYGYRVKVSATVRKMTNAHEEIGTASLMFVLQKFTLNGVSIRSNIATSQNRVGGIINRESNLEFYFNETDINFYDNGYWNKPYIVDWNGATETTTLGTINGILQNFNKFDLSKLENGVAFALVSNNNNTSIDLTNVIDGINEQNFNYIVKHNSTNFIEFSKDSNGKIIFKPLSVSLNNWSFVITLKYNFVDNLPNISSEGTQHISSRFGINVSEVSTLFDYKPVSTQQEFVDMVESNYYILTDDITLINYNLLDINLGGFDGNGHTITIKSFDYNTMATTSNEKTGYFGLFKEIYSGAIVKNLHIKYELDSRDLCEYSIGDDEYYDTIYFGGIAPKNNGIITNSIVEGDWNLSASMTSPSNFYLAGIVCNNAGYITNTTSKININAGGLVAGVATFNNGKISTTSFNGKISSYSSSSLSNLIRTAGFVLENSGEISLSCIQNDTKVRLESAGSIGGFVYNNTGKIYDCCLSNVTFNSRGEVGGFVHTSSGTIARCYVNSTESLQGDRSKDAFVFKKQSGSYQHCFYILDNNVASNISGINCILRINMLNESSYTNFLFTGDDYGVWKMTGNGPIITSAYTLIKPKTSTTTQVDGQDKTTFIVDGTKEIPYIIYDYSTYQYYMDATQFDDSLYGYYRLVCDIDLSSVKDNPTSSKYTFAGTLEGNNMIITGFGLYSTPNVSSIGLFKGTKNGTVNNLTIKPESIRASNSNTVGVLAGVIDGGKIYNISIDSDGLVVMGKNAVGGLAGIVKGGFSINGITSNVTVNAIYRQSVEKKINLYIGKYESNSATISNIDSVSYAGAIAGIVDGYDYRVATPVVLSNYYKIKNITINGNVVVVGEVVGGAFGLVASRSMVDNVIVDVNNQTALKGVYYSGGAVGENRGVVANAQINSSQNICDLFDSNMNGNYANVCGGVVSMNMGGLVYKSINTSNVISMVDLATVGGVVGRNVNGTIVDCVNTGAVYGYFAGGICGTDYTYDTFKNANTQGSITNTTKIALPSAKVDYSQIKIGSTITQDTIQNVKIADLKSWFAKEKEVLSAISCSVNQFYSYTYSASPESVALTYSRVLGAVLGVSDQYIAVNIDNNMLNISVGDNVVINNLEAVNVESNGVYFKKNSNGKYYGLNDRFEEVAVTDYKEGNSYEGYFKLNNSGEYDGMTYMLNFKDKYNNNERYSQLQQAITNTQNTTNLDYFFISCISKTTFDFWNSNEGYSPISYLFVL